jgi:hypothetical protein
MHFTLKVCFKSPRGLICPLQTLGPFGRCPFYILLWIHNSFCQTILHDVRKIIDFNCTVSEETSPKATGMLPKEIAFNFSCWIQLRPKKIYVRLGWQVDLVMLIICTPCQIFDICNGFWVIWQILQFYSYVLL